MKKIYSIAILILFYKTAAFSQNARFSQIWTAPLQYNASLTGRFDGSTRIIELMSWQKSNDPNKGRCEINHNDISIDFKLGKYRSYGDDKASNLNVSSMSLAKDVALTSQKNEGYWGVGFNYYTYSGIRKVVNTNFYSFSLARHFYSKSNKYYGFGTQVTSATGQLNRTSNLYLDKEIMGGGFHFNDNNIYNPKYFSKNYTDVNVGMYYGMVTDPILFEMGFAMNHLFYPKNSLKVSDDEPKLRHRITANSILRLKLNSRWGIVQKNIYWKEGLYLKSKSENLDSIQLVSFWSGLEFFKTSRSFRRVKVPGRKTSLNAINLNFGLYTRSFRTIMPYLNLNLSNSLNLRYSYEELVNFKKSTRYTLNRSEVAFIVNFGRNTVPGTKFYKKINFW